MKMCVYGTLKRDHSNNRFLRNSTFLGSFVTEPKYTMYNLGGYPAVYPEGNTSIQCEVFEVHPDDVKGIYYLEGYTGTKNHPNNYYDCITLDTPFGDAEMFVFKEQPNYSIIKSGTWTK